MTIVILSWEKESPKKDRILGTEQYFDFRSYVFFRSYAYFYLDFQSSGFLLIRSSEFGLMDQLVIYLPSIKKKTL